MSSRLVPNYRDKYVSTIVMQNKRADSVWPHGQQPQLTAGSGTASSPFNAKSAKSQGTQSIQLPSLLLCGLGSSATLR